jgi:WD40 repeat protein
MLDYDCYALEFSSIFAKDAHLAIGSFVSEPSNVIDVFGLVDDKKWVKRGTNRVKFPQTRIRFSPQASLSPIDTFISCDVNIHCFSIGADEIKETREIPITEKNCPLTCLDWSRMTDDVVMTGAIDGTVTAVGLTSGQAICCIQAHEHAVYDLSFCGVSATFVTGGLDGSLRIFDFRDTNSYILMYRSSMPIQRVMASPFDFWRISAFCKGSSNVMLFDVRNPGTTCGSFGGSSACIVGMAWSKLSPARIYGAHDDCTVFHCDVDQKVMTPVICGKSSKTVQSFAVGPMTLAMGTERQIEFVDAIESPPPLASSFI